MRDCGSEGGTGLICLWGCDSVAAAQAVAIAVCLSPCASGGVLLRCCGLRVAVVWDAKQYPFMPLEMGKLRLGLIRCVLSERPPENEENFACTVNLDRDAPAHAAACLSSPHAAEDLPARGAFGGRDPKFPSYLPNTMIEKHKKQPLSPPV